MACALCISNAPQRIALPHRLTGSCPLNATLSTKSTSFFAITVPDRANLRSDRPSASTGHPGSAAGALRIAPTSRVQAKCYAGLITSCHFPRSGRRIRNITPVQRDIHPEGLRSGGGLGLAGNVVSCLEVHNGGDIPNTIAIRFRTIRRANGARTYCLDRV